MEDFYAWVDLIGSLKQRRSNDLLLKLSSSTYSMYILDYIQTSFFYLGRFLRKLADDQKNCMFVLSQLTHKFWKLQGSFFFCHSVPIIAYFASQKCRNVFFFLFFIKFQLLHTLPHKSVEMEEYSFFRNILGVFKLDCIDFEQMNIVQVLIDLYLYM